MALLNNISPLDKAKAKLDERELTDARKIFNTSYHVLSNNGISIGDKLLLELKLNAIEIVIKKRL